MKKRVIEVAVKVIVAAGHHDHELHGPWALGVRDNEKGVSR